MKDRASGEGEERSEAPSSTRLTATHQLEAIRNAQKRTSYVFLVAAVVSLTVMIASFNLHYSFNRSLALMPSLTDSTARPEYTLQRELLSHWVRTSFVTVPLFGVGISANDVTFLGGIALFVISWWLFFAIQRERYLIDFLLKQSRGAGRPERLYVYYGLVAYSVFLGIRRRIEPDGSRPKDDPTPSFTIGPTYTVLFFLPAAAILFALVTDVLTGAAVVENAFRDESIPRVLQTDTGTLVKVILYGVSALLLGAFTSQFCWWAYRDEGRTRQAVKDFGDALASEAKATAD